MNDLTIQALGFVAFAINIVASSSVDDRRIRTLLCLSCLTFSVHFSLMGAYVAALNLLVNSFRAFVSLRYTGTKVFVLFVLVQAVMSIAFYSQPTDLLPAMASLISCYALFCAQGMKMRIAFLCCTFFWLMNSIVVGSYGGMMNDVFNATMLSITIFRLRRRARMLEPKFD